ncbi:aldehyde dehydrogenase family protein [Acidobacteriota bacterium]
MTLQPVLINGEWKQTHEAVDSFTATNPATESPLSDQYPVSGFSDIIQALEAGYRAMVELPSLPVDVIANFLKDFAVNIETRSEALIKKASHETGLPEEPRLRSIELPRAIDQIQQAATCVLDRSWRRATIDNKANVRSIHSALNGPVAVFGPNNFPFAFNSAGGGDFTAAIAAGNPVIAKANPGHPGTTKIFAEAALKALQKNGLPRAMVQLLYHFKPEDGLKLVSHPLLGATAFTGSKRSGLRLKEAADRAGKPIYLEMSSINPVFILPGVLEERLEELAEEFFNSCTLGSGLFCTKPGLVILLQDKKSERFLEETRKYFLSSKAGLLTGEQIPKVIEAAIKTLLQCGAETVAGGEEINGDGYRFAYTLMRVSGNVYLKNPKLLQTEVFGPSSLLVFAKNTIQLQEITAALEGSLTGSIYSHTQGKDDSIYAKLEPILRRKVGRLINDKMPTGVAVTPAMNHGGPFPATGHPGFTAIGIPAALLRFTALHCYDNVRHHRLPAELRDKNPTGYMWRYINGEWTQRSL